MPEYLFIGGDFDGEWKAAVKLWIFENKEY